MKPLATLASLALLAAPLTSRAEDWRWGEIPREELFATYFAECPNADVVVLVDHGIARVDTQFHMRLSRHVRTKILSDKGLDRAVVRIPYEAGQEIKNFRGQTIVPPGNVFKVEKGQMKDEADGTGRVLTISFPSAQKGVVLEWEYEIRSDRIDRIPPWSFQGRDFARVSRFELQTPPGLAFDAGFGWTPGLAPAPKQDVVNDPDDPKRTVARAVWELDNQAPLAQLALVPWPEDYRMTLHMQLVGYSSEDKSRVYKETVERSMSESSSEFKNFVMAQPWPAIAKTLAAETSKVLNDADGVAKWAGGDAANASTGGGDAVARALFARVRDGLATDTARPGQKPASPRQVVAAGHGTAYEKNLVLLKLLRDHSIAADPVLVRSRALGPFQERRHDPGQFDHLVVRASLDGQTVWLDAAPSCPFGTLPPESRVQKGLLAREDAGTVVDVNAPQLETARSVTTSASLDERGTLVAHSIVKLTGDRALLARRDLAKLGEAAWVEPMLRGRFGDSLTIESVKVEGASDPEAPLSVDVAYRVPMYARGQADRMTCTLPFVDVMGPNPLKDDARVIPAELPFGGTSREDVTVKLPAGVLVETVPAAGNVRTAALSLKTTYTKVDGGLTSTREVRATQTQFEHEELAALRKFFDQARAVDQAEFAVRRQTMRSATGR